MNITLKPGDAVEVKTFNADATQTPHLFVNGKYCGALTAAGIEKVAKVITQLPRQFPHLSALELRLSNERNRLSAAKTDVERELRRVWVAQIEKEIAQEREFLGIEAPEPCDLSDDELLAELTA